MIQSLVKSNWKLHKGYMSWESFNRKVLIGKKKNNITVYTM
ncbi:Uncharacterised protein [Clostridium putrefaciens]|uniref:Uncharacterized protein n=1 Tax=Clostridium putrefaciens TaxID=99675 RepID=A0A381J503_9CLOT|nr:Uncharacterised protein [Clostridium putrefaciens]